MTLFPDLNDELTKDELNSFYDVYKIGYRITTSKDVAVPTPDELQLLYKIEKGYVF